MEKQVENRKYRKCKLDLKKKEYKMVIYLV